MQDKETIIVGLDIGTTKICAVVGEVINDRVNIIGLGQSPSNGVRKGAVINIESTVTAIEQAVEEAAVMAECDITSVYVGIAGDHIKGFNSHGITAIKGEEITAEDVARVIETARDVAVKPERYTLHVIPQEFIVDDQEAIQNPVGMTGVRLETKIHVVTGANSSVGNIVKCCKRAGLAVDGIVLESMASGEAVLTPEEKELGCLLVDMGGGTTDLAIFKGNNVKYTFELPLGGQTVTNDLSICLRTPTNEAEQIKLTHGTCARGDLKKGENIDVSGVGGRESKKLSRDILVDIIEPRMDEMGQILKDEIHRNGMENAFPSGIILTGGTAKLKGVEEVMEAVFNVPVRRGVPMNIDGLTAMVDTPHLCHRCGTCGLRQQKRPSAPVRHHRQNRIGKLVSGFMAWLRKII